MYRTATRTASGYNGAA